MHDVAQALLFLLAQPALVLQHGRWLPPAALRALNGRLLRPAPEPLPRTHKRTRRLCFLFFLAAAAGLLADGGLTPAAWAWLAELPGPRLAWLWQAWRDAPLALRQAYAQPEARLPPPWPGLLLDRLARQAGPFTPAGLADALLGTEAGYTAYFAAHLADVQTLDTLVAEALATSLGDWGLVAPAVPTEPADASRHAYTLTQFGRWLLTASGDLPAPPWPFDTWHAVSLDTRSPGAWRLAIPVWAPPQPQAMLALHATYQELSRQTGPPCHVYRLHEATWPRPPRPVMGLAGLLQALQDLGLSLAPEQLARLQVWHARGQEIEIAVLPLLRTASADLLRRLLDQATAAHGPGRDHRPNGRHLERTRCRGPRTSARRRFLS